MHSSMQTADHYCYGYTHKYILTWFNCMVCICSEMILIFFFANILVFTDEIGVNYTTLYSTASCIMG